MGTAVAVGGVVAACGGVRTAAGPEPIVDRIAIVAAERGPNGARLVAIDEHGDRQFVLIAPAAGPPVRDTNPAISPAADWVVFASSRDRPSGTSLWIAPLEADAVPTRLTDGPSIEAHPTWTPDGAAIVYASTRARGDFDLWRQRLDRGRAVGPPERLTTSEDQEVTPSVAHDGTIYHGVVHLLVGGPEVTSRIDRLAPDGMVQAVTEGPADTTPALSPDGATLAFARPVMHAGGPSSELWTMPVGGGAATTRTVLPLTEESGPVWSRDGRVLFGTSLLRGEAGVLLSSVVYVDLTEASRTPRILRDHAGAIARLTPAIATSALDLDALRGNPAYLPELARIMASAIEDQQLHESGLR